MKKKFCIIFFSISCLFINLCHAGFLDTLQEKRAKAIKEIKSEQKKRQIEMKPEKKIIMTTDTQSKSFKNRTTIFVIGLSSLWMFICIYAIAAKSNKKI